MHSNQVRHDALYAMWNFLHMGGQKVNIPALKENCELLQRAMMQKTAGQRSNKRTDVDFRELDAIINGVVIETMALYLSGDLNILQTEIENERRC